ncbi:MAG: response regulator [Gammaproteobacteria bacterium]|nr:response regulator [Gammaproteobacteria bacterium]MDH5652976.1 response regulator [Gammaproteobacteria bacterium]
MIGHAPIFFPTKIAIIDDDPDYLTQVEMLLEDEPVCQLFTSPLKALEEIEKNRLTNSQFAEQCAAYVTTNLTMKQPGNGTCHLHRFSNDKLRFERFSIIVLDYQMPEIDGLEMCRRIYDPLVKKIMLTGEASNDIAVKALNRGMIDYFIRKDDPGVASKLNRAIRDLSNRYFDEISSSKKTELKKQIPFLFDPQFMLNFRILRQKHNIIEFYLKKNEFVNVFKLVNKTGDLKYMLVQTKDQAKAQYESLLNDKHEYMARALRQIDRKDVTDQSVEKLLVNLGVSIIIRNEILKSIESRRTIAWFAGHGHYDDRFKNNWHDHVYSAEVCGNYSYALVNTDALAGMDGEQVTFSYEHFLQECN